MVQKWFLRWFGNNSANFTTSTQLQYQNLSGPLNCKKNYFAIFCVDSSVLSYWFALVLHKCRNGFAQMLRWFCTNVAMVLHKCRNGFAQMSQWFCTNVAMVFNNVVMVFRQCRNDLKQCRKDFASMLQWVCMQLCGNGFSSMSQLFFNNFAIFLHSSTMDCKCSF